MVLISDMGKMRLREVRDDTRGPITVTRRRLRRSLLLFGCPES